MKCFLDRNICISKIYKELNLTWTFIVFSIRNRRRHVVGLIYWLFILVYYSHIIKLCLFLWIAVIFLFNSLKIIYLLLKIDYLVNHLINFLLVIVLFLFKLSPFEKVLFWDELAAWDTLILQNNFHSVILKKRLTREWKWRITNLNEIAAFTKERATIS